MRLCEVALVGFLLSSLTLGAQPTPPESREVVPIDFARVSRELKSAPRMVASTPLWGMFLFGQHGEKRMWAVLDKSRAQSPAYDVLHLDLDCDGEMGEDGERFAATKVGSAGEPPEFYSVFDIAQLRDPATGATHRKFRLTAMKERVRFSMSWRGEKKTMGLFGPRPELRANFSADRKKAPIVVPGYDRPFEFQHWMCGTLQRGRTTDFKVFIGNRGSKRGAFACVDQEFLPADEFPVATLIYTDASGKEQRHHVKLTERC